MTNDPVHINLTPGEPARILPGQDYVVHWKGPISTAPANIHDASQDAWSKQQAKFHAATDRIAALEAERDRLKMLVTNGIKECDKWREHNTEMTARIDAMLPVVKAAEAWESYRGNSKPFLSRDAENALVEAIYAYRKAVG